MKGGGWGGGGGGVIWGNELAMFCRHYRPLVCFHASNIRTVVIDRAVIMATIFLAFSLLLLRHVSFSV